MTMHCRVSKFRFAQSETIPRRVQGAKFKICEQETGRDAATSPDGEAENEQSQKLMKRAKGQCNRLFSRPSTGWSARDSKPSQERVEQSGARAKRSREGKEGAKDEESDQDTETRQDCAKPLRTTRQQVGPSQRRDKRRGTWGAEKGMGTNVDDLTEVGESLEGGRDHRGQSQIDHLKGRVAGGLSELTETKRTWERISVVVFHERFPGGARKKGRPGKAGIERIERSQPTHQQQAHPRPNDKSGYRRRRRGGEKSTAWERGDPSLSSGFSPPS